MNKSRWLAMTFRGSLSSARPTAIFTEQLLWADGVWLLLEPPPPPSSWLLPAEPREDYARGLLKEAFLLQLRAD